MVYHLFYRTSKLNSTSVPIHFSDHHQQQQSDEDEVRTTRTACVAELDRLIRD